MSGALFDFPPPQLLSDPSSLTRALDDSNIDPALLELSAAGSASPLETPSSPSATPVREFNAGDKRPAEDLCQYAAAAGRQVRLKADDQHEAERFARLTQAQRQVWGAVHMLKLQDQLQAIQPAKALWSMSDTLTAKIEQYSFAILVSPALMFYVKEAAPVKLIIGILESHPEWGYTKPVRNDKYKSDIVKDRAKVRLTDRRSNIKDMITLSFGPEDWVPALKESASKKTVPIRLNIVQLCTAISKKHPINPPAVSLQMCARFAFLRYVLKQLLTKADLANKSSRNYWSLVDDQLVILRANTEPGMVNRVLTKILEDDRKDYGRPDAQDEPQESNTVQSADQRIADHAATGTFVEDDD